MVTVAVPDVVGQVAVVVTALTPASFATGATSKAPMVGIVVLRVVPTISAVIAGLVIFSPARRAMVVVERSPVEALGKAGTVFSECVLPPNTEAMLGAVPLTLVAVLLLI